MEKAIPGLTDTMDYTRIARWNEVIVYSSPGPYKDLGQFQARQAAVKSRIRLAGVFRSSSNMCTATPRVGVGPVQIRRRIRRLRSL
jgi:protoporphyrinogen/coproporphyrinogen III oxidase